MKLYESFFVHFHGGTVVSLRVPCSFNLYIPDQDGILHSRLQTIIDSTCPFITTLSANYFIVLFASSCSYLPPYTSCFSRFFLLLFTLQLHCFSTIVFIKQVIKSYGEPLASFSDFNLSTWHQKRNWIWMRNKHNLFKVFFNRVSFQFVVVRWWCTKTKLESLCVA